MNIFKSLEEYAAHIALIIVICVLSMVAYFATSDEPIPKRKKSTLAGGVIALILSYPTWLAIGQFVNAQHVGEFWLIPITFTYTVTGQFLPDFLQNVVPKFVKKIVNYFFKKTTGEDLE